MSPDINYAKADELAILIEERFLQLVQEGAFADLEPHLTALAATGNEDQAVTLSLQLRLSDSEREREIIVSETSRAWLADGETMDFNNSDTAVRYLCDGEIRVFQHSSCPHCWGEWEDKHHNPTCPDCGYELGNQVKILMDDSVCPYCLEGKVSRQEPTCSTCGEVVEERYVSWG
ncbi:MAG TPA: hypothetical protein PKM44_05640 [Turneriella sp.]|nr:hypothetical protein [Turneriella sp.]